MQKQQLGSTADNNLASIAYEQVAHRSRLHPSVCRRVVQEALLLLSQRISGPQSLQVSVELALQLGMQSQDVSNSEWQGKSH